MSHSKKAPSAELSILLLIFRPMVGGSGLPHCWRLRYQEDMNK